MLTLFLNLWYSLPIGWRRVLVAAPLPAGVVVGVLSWSWIPLAVGAGVSFVLFVLPGPGESEKRGYRF